VSEFTFSQKFLLHLCTFPSRLAKNLEKVIIALQRTNRELKYARIRIKYAKLHKITRPSLEVKLVKPKFHYADFATKSATSPRQVHDEVAELSRTQIMRVRDTNHVADFRDLCPRQSSRILSPTLSPTARRYFEIEILVGIRAALTASQQFSQRMNASV